MTFPVRVNGYEVVVKIEEDVLASILGQSPRDVDYMGLSAAVGISVRRLERLVAAQSISCRRDGRNVRFNVATVRRELDEMGLVQGRKIWMSESLANARKRNGTSGVENDATKWVGGFEKKGIAR